MDGSVVGVLALGETEAQADRLKRMLEESAGLDVTCAAPLGALSQFTEAPHPDICILSVAVVDEPLLQLIRLLCAGALPFPLLVAAETAHEEDVLRVLRAGAADCIGGPDLTPGALVHATWSVVRRHRLASAHQSETEARFRAMAEILPAVFWMVSPGRDQAFYVSPAFERVFGCPLTYVYENPLFWIDLMHPDDRESALAYIEAHRGQRFDVEYRIVRRDNGETRWLRSVVTPVVDGEGHVDVITGITEDITERKESEAELHNYRHHLEKLVNDRTESLLKTNKDLQLQNTDRVRAEKELRYRFRLEQLVAAISTRFMTSPSEEVDRCIDWALERIGRFATADRCSLFEVAPDAQSASNTHEWCSDGIASQRDMLQALPASVLPEWADRLSRFDVVHVPDIAALPEDSAARGLMESLDLRAILLVPIAMDNRPRSFIGLDAVAKLPAWGLETEAALRITGELAVNALARRQADDALRLHHRALEAAVNAVMICDRTGAITWVNQAFSDLTGYAAGEVVGRNPSLLRSNEHPPEFYRCLWETILKGDVWQGEIVNRRKDGSLYVEETAITPVLDSVGEVTHFISVRRDTTQTRRAAALLRESEEKYRTLVESVGEAIVVIDGSGLFRFVNTVAAQRMGGDPDDFVGVSMWDVFPHDVADEQMANVRSVIQSGAGRSVERIFTLNNAERWYRARIEPILGQTDEDTSALAFVFDITDRKRAEEEVQRSEEAARRFQSQLTVLHEVIVTLAGTRSCDELCRSTVELATTRLGLDRFSLWFLGEDASTLHGSFGIDAAGVLCDERLERIPLRQDTPWWRVLREHERFVVEGPGPILDNEGVPVGRGWAAFAGLWDGEQIVGCMVSDNLLSGGPMSDERAKLLTLFATAVGHLYAVRKREDELRLFKRVVDASREAIAISVLDGPLVYVNEAHQRLFGRPLESAITTLPEDTYVPDSVHVYRGQCLPALRRGEGWEGELVARDVFGSHLRLSYRADIVRDSEGNPAYTIGLMHDITDRKQSEEALRASESRYRNLVDCSADVVWRADLRGRFTFVNSTAAAMLGYEPRELIGRPFNEVLTPESARWARERFRSLGRHEAESSIVLELLHRRKDGTELVGEVRATMIANTRGRVVEIQGVTRDATERRHAEEALRESEERYRALVEYAPDAILVMDAVTGMYTDANEKAESLFRLPRPELLSMTPLDLSPEIQPSGESSADLAKARIEETLDGNVPSFEWTHQRSDGSPIPCEVTLIRLPASGNPELRVSIVDVSERKRAERLIAEQRMKMIASSRLSALGVMAGGVAHEINNPLAIIGGGVEQLARLATSEDLDRARLQHIIGQVNRNVGRIERIVRGLRNLSKDGAGTPFEFTTVQTLVDDTLELCRERFRAHDVVLNISPIPQDLRIECRPTQLAQVVLNLLNNAHDAVAGERDPWVRLATLDLGESVEIEVVDSGTGPPRELQERIFEPFFTTKDVGDGTGLGLSISDGIVAGHHGQLYLDPVSETTRFAVRLPKRQPTSTVGSPPHDRSN
ncbi:MAG: PAS domain S-box protein [bacterium]|nr:PAS domain S-box protein [bacterium]